MLSDRPLPRAKVEGGALGAVANAPAPSLGSDTRTLLRKTNSGRQTPGSRRLPRWMRS